MLDDLIRDLESSLNLGNQGRPLVGMLLAHMDDPAQGGLRGFLDKFRNAGWGSMVQSWLGTSSAPQVPSNAQVETVLGAGTGFLDKVAAALGMPYDKVSTAIAALIPMLVARLTPTGAIPAALPPEFSALASTGRSLLGLGAAGLAAAAPAASVASTPVAASSGGIGKWLPWLIAALVVIFGIGYCSKNKQADPVPAPAPATEPAPAPAAPEPAPAPAPAPEPPAPAASVPSPSAASEGFTAPDGAGVLDGLQQEVPLLRVFFDTGKTEVAPEFADKAKALVAYLQANADVKAIISGFNDPTGDPAKNAELSKRRAEAVQSALVAAGVPADRTALEKPAETTDTGPTNASSRRVDVMLRK